MSDNYYKRGTWYVICDRCGGKFRSDQVKKTWDGFYVCNKDYESRHIADFIRAPKPIRPLPWTRPDVASNTDVSVGPTYDSDVTGLGGSTTPTVVPIPPIIVDSTGKIEQPTGPSNPTDPTDPDDPDDQLFPTKPTYPIGPVRVPVVIPEGVRPPTLVIDTRWPDDTIFDITNNDPNDIPVINPATYPEYTINRVGDNWGGSGTILYLYISANVDNSGNDVLAYANSTVYPLADVYNQVYTWIIVVTGNIDGLTLQNFPVGCSAIIINQATISQAYDIGNEGHGGSGGTSNFGAIRAASVNGFA